MNPIPVSSPIQPEPSAAPAPTDSALDAVAARKPTRISVMCPAGFTPYAVDGLGLDRPLFALVTYQPE